jgi:hypothetical protein
MGQTLNVEGLRKRVNLFARAVSTLIHLLSPHSNNPSMGGDLIWPSGNLLSPCLGWVIRSPAICLPSGYSFRRGAGNLIEGAYIVMSAGLDCLTGDVVYNRSRLR